MNTISGRADRAGIAACIVVIASWFAAIATAQEEFTQLPAVENQAADVVVDAATEPYSPEPTAGGWFANLESIRYPNDLLWEPPFASKREPRMQGIATSLDNHADAWSVETWIGATFGLCRIARTDVPNHAFQLDFFAVVQTRLSPEDLIAADYRFGMPFTFRAGPWSMKAGYEHTSAHVGDEGLLRGGIPVRNYAKDELVFAVDRWFANRVRPYGQVSYAMCQDLPDEKVSRWRADVGFETYDRLNDSIRGVPFAAVHADFRGEMHHKGNLNVQLGWLWRSPEQAKVRGRLFAEYYVGRSPYGQFIGKTEQFVGGGIAYDY